MPARPEFYYSEERQQYRKRMKINGRRHDLWADTKEELRKRIREIENNREMGIVFDDDTTVFEFATEWAPIAVSGLSPAGQRDITNPLNNHILPFFQDMKLRDVRPMHISKLMLTLDGKSRSLQSKVLRVVRNLFETACENGLIVKSPVPARIKAGGAPAEEKTPLTQEQQSALLSAVKGTRAYVFVALGLYAGLRREEILALAWSDVHLNSAAPYLEVTHAVRFENNTAVRSSKLKTKAAKRKIPIPPPLAEILRAEKQSMASGKIPVSLLVVPDSTGSLCSMQAFRNIWKLVQRRTYDPDDLKTKSTPKNSPHKFHCDKTLNFHVTPHLLRHTYITRLCASGMDIKKVQYLAGHSSVDITLRIYAHVVNNRPDEIYSSISDAFDQKTEKALGV